MQFLQYLRDEYRAPNGKKVSEKTIKHHFDIIRILFNYAEKQEVIEKNPIKKVDPPANDQTPCGCADAGTSEGVFLGPVRVQIGISLHDAPACDNRSAAGRMPRLTMAGF